MIMSIKMALRSISSNKLRALLTMLGIVIGVMALVVLVSLVSGATSSVTDAVSSLGSDMLTVKVSNDYGKPFSLDDLNSMTDSEPLIGLCAPSVSTSVTGKYNADSDSFTIYGATPSCYDINGLKLSMGRFIKQTDVDNNTRVCVINNSAAQELIGFEDCVGKEISFNGTKYTIVGVLSSDESLASSLLAGSYSAYIPYTSLMRLSDSVSSSIASFVVAAPDYASIDDTKTALNDILLERFEQDDEAFRIRSTNIMEEAMSSISSILSILLGGIAGISLIVGGIGIMNIMLVTVTERTKEIGIRKAIGASRGTILRQFLVEAVVLCMMGCAIGIFLSWTILRIVGIIASSLSMKFSLNGGVVLVAVLFCLFIGIVFGLYPANKAAKMKPIDALHYEG